MSVIGPRPGLWNQDILTAERDKYNANDVKPGLTGWAQINGRDELEIPDKAKLDGEYVSKMGLGKYFGSRDIEPCDETIENISKEEQELLMLYRKCTPSKRHLLKVYLQMLTQFQEKF